MVLESNRHSTSCYYGPILCRNLDLVHVGIPIDHVYIMATMYGSYSTNNVW